MKVSFSLPSSSKPSNSTVRSSSDQRQQKEFITEFDPSKPLTDSPSIVIPPIPNQWNPQNQPTNIQFETDPNSASEARVSDSKPSIDGLMLMKLRSDLQKLPDGTGYGEYEDVPVEDFASAYLKGYGWYEGRGIGKNAKEDVKVVQYTNNAAGEGLGFARMRNHRMSVLTLEEKDRFCERE